MMKTLEITKKLLSFGCAAALTLSMGNFAAVATAFADAGTQNSAGDASESAVYACNNGWQLTYSTINSKVRIDGVAQTGQGTLQIPSEIDGLPVVIVGSGAFKDCKSLTSVVIPDSVQIFKSEAFCASGLTSVSIPASVTALSYRCFKSCTDLSNVTFEGDTMLYLGQEAFMYCSALVDISLPTLTSYAKYSSNADETDAQGVERFATTSSIDKSCFAQCTELTTMTFRGVVEHSTPDYFLDISCFNGDTNLKYFIWKIKKDTVGSGTGGNKQFVVNDCYSLDFYASEDDADNLTNRLASVTYASKDKDNKSVIKVLGLLNGTEDYSEYKLDAYPDAIPECPAGKVWGVADGGAAGGYTYLTDSYQVVAVDKDNLDYGWVGSDRINKWNEGVAKSTSMSMGNTYPTLYLEKDGSIRDFSTMAAYAPNGEKLQSDEYDLVFEQTVLVPTGSNNNLTETTWDVIDKDDIKEPGRYRVHAESKADSSKQTATVTFNVAQFSPSVTEYSKYSYVNILGKISADLAYQLDGDTEYDVVVPCSDWRFQMTGAGLASAGNGLMLFDNGADVSNDAYRTHIATESTSIQIIGSTSVVPQSIDVTKNVYLSDWLLSTLKGDQTRYKNDSSAQTLSNQVYTVMTNDYWDSTYGSTAVVVSDTKALNTMPIVQSIYEEQAPVFFANSAGTLSSSDLATLKSGGFEKIIIAGDSSYVSTSCENSIKSATGIEPVRVLDTASNACEASIEYAKGWIEQGNTYAHVAVADGTDSASIALAAETAAVNDGIVLVCSSTSDVKRVQNFLYDIIAENGISTVENLYVVGTFASVQSDALASLKSIWSMSGNVDTDASDTVEVDGCSYKITGTSTAQLVRAFDRIGSAVTVNSVKIDGKTYAVTSVGANAFDENVTTVTLGKNVKSINAKAFSSSKALTTFKAQNTALKQVPAALFSGLTKLKTVSFAGAVTSVGKNAFKGCTALTSLKLGTKVKTVGASAFQNCTKLTSLGFGAAVTTIGASAFQGCSKLKAVSFGNKLSSICKAAFQKCKALKTITIKSTKLKSGKVGSKAFTGTAAKAKVKVPKAKMKAYKKLFVKAGLSKKAKIAKC